MLEVAPKSAYLVVDLRRIEFIETMVIQALVVAKKKMAERGTDLSVTGFSMDGQECPSYC